MVLSIIQELLFSDALNFFAYGWHVGELSFDDL